MNIAIVISLIVAWLAAGWYATKMIKRRDFEAPPAVDLIIVLHGFLSLISAWAVQHLLFPGEDGKSKTVFLKDGMTLDLDNPEHEEMYNKLKSMTKNK